MRVIISNAVSTRRAIDAVTAPLAPAFLGIEESFARRRWEARPADERLAQTLAQRLSLPEIVGRVLAGRGIGIDDAAAYLDPTLRDSLPDPAHLLDMDAAVTRLAKAVMDGEGIAVFGDYDVDGATSTALLVRFFAAIGVALQTHIPDRRREGYGPNEAALRALYDAGARVTITVDCGTAAFEPLAAAADFGLDVIVVDHHVAEARLPAAFAVVNPNRVDETSPYGQLAAVGVAFLLIVALNRRLREAGAYGAARPEPDLRAWLDLVALGTVCDVVPLVGVNRAFVAQGLKVMAGRKNRGLAALADQLRINDRPGAYHLGYILGPRINAGGRVGEAALGARLLATEDGEEARVLAERLDAYNRERREIEAGMQEAALEKAADMADWPCLFVTGEGWHRGVVGLVASRLTERYHRPAVAMSVENGIAQGSARSVPGFDIGNAVIAARQAGLLIKGGGHAMAAGFTAAAGNLDALRDFLHERMRTGPVLEQNPRLYLDGALASDAANTDFATLIEKLEPFGAGNAEPRFAVSGLRVASAALVGQDHIRCTLTGLDGGRLKGIAFRSAGTGLGRGLRDSAGAALHVAGHIRVDRWGARTGVELHIDDAAPMRPE